MSCLFFESPVFPSCQLSYPRTISKFSSPGGGKQSSGRGYTYPRKPPGLSSPPGSPHHPTAYPSPPGGGGETCVPLLSCTRPPLRFPFYCLLSQLWVDVDTLQCQCRTVGYAFEAARDFPFLPRPASVGTARPLSLLSLAPHLSHTSCAHIPVGFSFSSTNRVFNAQPPFAVQTCGVPPTPVGSPTCQGVLANQGRVTPKRSCGAAVGVWSVLTAEGTLAERGGGRAALAFTSCSHRCPRF